MSILDDDPIQDTDNSPLTKLISEINNQRDSVKVRPNSLEENSSPPITNRVQKAIRNSLKLINDLKIK